MASSLDSTRLALRPGTTIARPQGAWWPEDRSLGSQLTSFFDLWPSGQGRICRVLYSSPDWDDHPHSVQVTGRRIKTASIPQDDTHELTLVMHDGKRRFIAVIPPGTSQRKATRILDAMAKGRSKHRNSDHGADDQGEWDNEGGHI